MQTNLVKRERFLEMIRPVYDVDIIKVLMGPRRSGKSVILSMIAEEIDADDDHKIFINFEDMKYDSLSTAAALNEYVLGLMGEEGKYYLFFDEIQNVKDFTRVLASLKSTGRCSIFVTGSNSKMLSGELATLITGRTIQFEILPFSYSEAKEYLRLTTGSVPDNFISDYIKLGGYPQRFQMGGESLSRRFLEELYQSIIEKDIHNRHPDLDLEKFERIASFVLANCGNDFSAKTISGYLKREGLNVSIQSVHNYLNLMEEAYLLKRASIYDISGKNILASKPKNYALDNGFRYIKTNTIDIQNGYFLENIVYLELLGRGYAVYVGKKYNGEIDFVAVKDGKKCFIQVAYMIIDDATVTREFGAFSSVRDASPKYVISLDPFDMSRDGITHLNLMDFLEGRKDVMLS